ncbi:MAG: ATP-binding protein [bacterium]
MLKKIIQSHREEFDQKRNDFFVDREIQIKGFESDLIHIIIGPRRAGKSFFSIRSMEPLLPVGYVNFDDERLTGITGFDELLDAINQVYVNPKALLFDEIQNVNGWELIMNRLQRQGYNLFITGSNSKLLSHELATHLTGRHLTTCLFPFSFREIRQLTDPKETRGDVRQQCAEYITRGGFPELWVKKLDSPHYLTSLFDSILFKDIVKRHKIRNTSALDALAVFLVSNIATEFSFQTIAQRLSFRSVATLQKYIEYLEEAFLLFTIQRFSFKIREQISSNKKVYCYDDGFYQAKAYKFSPNLGRLFENAVAIELKRREMEGSIKLFYWKNEKHEEVDFVVQQGLKVKQLIQVCYDLTEPKVREQEIRALLKAGASLDCTRLIVITDDYENLETCSWFGFTGEVAFVPLWKWLLKGNDDYLS